MRCTLTTVTTPFGSTPRTDPPCDHRRTRGVNQPHLRVIRRRRATTQVALATPEARGRLCVCFSSVRLEIVNSRGSLRACPGTAGRPRCEFLPGQHRLQTASQIVDDWASDAGTAPSRSTSPRGRDREVARDRGTDVANLTRRRRPSLPHRAASPTRHGPCGRFPIVGPVSPVLFVALRAALPARCRALFYCDT